MHYRIRVRGHLDPAWAAWFDGLTITHEAGGDTTLAGPLADQAALYGVLGRARDLGLTLVSVHEAGAAEGGTRTTAAGSVDAAPPVGIPEGGDG